MTIKVPTLSAIGEAEAKQFQDEGYLVVEKLIGEADVERIRDRFDPVLAGDFETGVYPDEWYWRPGMSLPDVTRHMANLWKSDLTIAGLVVSSEIARVSAFLAGWPGTRLGQDTLWMKPELSKEISLHQDNSFVDFLDPPEMLTCWVPLDDTQIDGGTLEYVPGSHTWDLVPLPRDFHVPEEHYKSKMLVAAERAGIQNPETVPIEVKAGGCAFHHGNIWHGSGPNQRSDIVRRSIGVHAVSSVTKFPEEGAGYIYGRYKRIGDVSMDESFFPVLWTPDGYRTPFLADYCAEMAVL